MRIRITERQMGLLREAMSVGPEGELNISSGGMDNIIGKKVGDVFGSIQGINIISDKPIAYSKFFEGDGSSFSAISKAEKYNVHLYIVKTIYEDNYETQTID